MGLEEKGLGGLEGGRLLAWMRSGSGGGLDGIAIGFEGVSPGVHRWAILVQRKVQPSWHGCSEMLGDYP